MADDSAANDSPSIVKESGKEKKKMPDQDGAKERTAKGQTGINFPGENAKEKNRAGETHSDHNRL